MNQKIHIKLFSKIHQKKEEEEEKYFIPGK